MKWIAPLAAYLAVGMGLFLFHSAWITLLVFHLVIVTSLLLAKPALPLRILFTSTDIKWIVFTVLLCGSSGIIVYFLWDYTGMVTSLSLQTETLGLNSSTWPLFILYFSLANPLIEEYFWRGYLGSPTEDLYISDFAYSGFHGLILWNRMKTDGIAYMLAILVLAGWFWRQIARKDRGLLAPVLGHMAADFSILLAVYFKLSI